jgi:hypothetical protein
MRLFLLIPALFLLAPSQSRPADAPPATASETLHYNVEWRLVPAGTVRLERKFSGGEYQARLQVQSTGLVSMLYRVDDLYLAQFKENLCVVSSFLTAREGTRQRETRVTYDSGRRKANYVERDVSKNANLATHEIDIPACTHDVLGGLYSLRAMRLALGRSAEIPMSDGKKSVTARVEAQQQETVTTPAGRFRTIRYEVFLFDNILYHRSGTLHVWLTDDDRRLPVQIRVRLAFPIGAITLQLQKVESK